MSNFPSDFDDDTTLPFVNDNITEIGGEAINALRDAVFALEQNIGIGAAGTTSSIAERFGVSFFPDGYLKPSVITSLGLVTLPITQDQIAPWAMIPESKLRLDHRTQDLFNYIRDLSGDVNLAIGWISTTGVKLDPHLLGAIYRHTLDQIDVHSNPLNFLSNKFRVLRDNFQSYNLVRDMNTELLAHQWADGSPFGNIQNVFTNNNSTYPSNYAHIASGIFLNTTRFTTIPQTALDLQLFAEFIDGASIFLLGTRIQNLYSNGISRASRSSALDSESQINGIGQHLIPVTSAVAYLKNTGSSSSPFDDINTGDDIIEFKPSLVDQNNNSFDAKFALVKVGDIIRVNYGTIEIPFIIKEKKYIQDSGNKKYIIRIDGKNIAYTTTATARIDRPLFYNNKYGVLSLAAANNSFTEIPSLIVASPKGGEALGVGFSPEQFDESHYLLYLALYPTGQAQDGYTILPPIDVTGNLGVTPGLYSLDSIVEATNKAFRTAGYNYRFVAFSYQGEFGIMLADSYSNAAFSILNGVVDENGFFDQLATELTFSNNVIDLFPSIGTVGLDPLGFGPFGANVASPPYMTEYGSAEASQSPTKLFVPLSKNNFYINGGERDRLTLEVGQALDGYGDGYWFATIVDKQVFPGPVPSGRVQTTYRIPLDLSTSTLKVGKTLVVQSGDGAFVDFGRFIIQSVTFACSPTSYTDITVYDAVHAKGFSPTTTAAVGSTVAIYFNSDSVSFNDETATDFSNVTPFKRHFEVYIKQDGATFTHERGRFLASGTSIIVNSGVTLYSSTEISKMDIIKISPKLRGYQFGSVNKISLHINNYNATTGVFDGFLASYDGITFTKQGPTIFGRKGEVTRFYDETNIDYIDMIIDITLTVINVSNQTVDIQLFPTLSLDDEIMLIGTCQLNDTNNFVNRVRDERQFGNISEKEISTSLYNFMAAPERLLHFNGVVRGFDIVDVTNEAISLRGGVALVNGKFQSLNNEVFYIPKIKELYSFSFYPVNWILCVDSIGEFVSIPMLDYDSVLGTPNDPTRLFTASNSVSLNTYNIDSVTFLSLLSDRKDLTALYVISSTVTGTGPSATVSLTSKDVRRFINDQDSCTPVVITTGSTQGNFHNFTAAANWIKLDSTLQNEIQIKGSHTVTTDPLFYVDELAIDTKFGNTMSIVGQSSGAVLTFSQSISLSNIKFKDLIVNFDGPDTLLTNVEFDNCEVHATGTVTLGQYSFVSQQFVARNSRIEINLINKEPIIGNENLPTTINNAVFDNCIVIFGSTVPATKVVFRDCSLTFYNGGTFSEVSIDPTNLAVYKTIDVSNVYIANCTITAGAQRTFRITGNNVVIEKNKISYGPPSLTGFTSSDLVNASDGMIFADASGTLSTIRVSDNVITLFSADGTQTHFPYVSIRLSSVFTSLQDTEISRNKFIVQSSADDLRAVISIISNVATSIGTTNPRFPKLTNVFIENNICSHNQMILVSSVRTYPVNNPLLTATNTRISNNVCGTIGFMTAGNSVTNFANSGVGAVADKRDHLVISGNSCKLIANIDAIGDYIPFNPAVFPINNNAYVECATGAFTIFSNSVNWIQVGASGFQPPGNQMPRDGGMIINNRLSPANPTYLSNYTDSSGSGITPANVGILLRREGNTPLYVKSIISGNILIQEEQIASDSSLVTYYYDTAIACFSNANIIGNHVSRVVHKTATPLSDYSAILYLGGTCELIVRDNNFDRSFLELQAYIKGTAGATSSVSITNNIFDSQYIDVSNTIETVGVDIPAAWSYHSNRNQIFYREISLADGTGLSSSVNFGGSAENLAWGTAPAAQIFHINYSNSNWFVQVYRQIGPNSWSEVASTEYITTHDFDDDYSHQKNWSVRGAIDPYVPENIKLLSAKVGYFAASWTGANILDYTTTPAKCAASLTILHYKDTTTSNDPTNGVLNPVANLTSHGGSFGTDLSLLEKTVAVHFISSSAIESALRVAPIYLTVDLSAKDYTSGKGYRLAFEVDQCYKKAASGSSGRHYFFDWSPVVLKCIYR